MYNKNIEIEGQVKNSKYPLIQTTNNQTSEVNIKPLMMNKNYTVQKAIDGPQLKYLAFPTLQ